MATIVEGDPKVPFSIATTPRCRGGRYSFPWISPLYPWSLPYNAECKARRYQVPFFKIFGMTRPGIELRAIGEHSNHFANVRYIDGKRNKILEYWKGSSRKSEEHGNGMKHLIRTEDFIRVEPQTVRIHIWSQKRIANGYIIENFKIGNWTDDIRFWHNVRKREHNPASISPIWTRICLLKSKKSRKC